MGYKILLIGKQMIDVFCDVILDEYRLQIGVIGGCIFWIKYVKGKKELRRIFQVKRRVEDRYNVKQFYGYIDGYILF